MEAGMRVQKEIGKKIRVLLPSIRTSGTTPAGLFLPTRAKLQQVCNEAI